MSRITSKASTPRRAAEAAPRPDVFGSVARDSLTAFRERFQQPEAVTGRYAEISTATSVNENRHTLNSSLAALTVSALGLAVAGAVTMTSSAQAANPQAMIEAQQQTVSSATIAEPAPASPASEVVEGADLGATNSADKASEIGSLEGRTSSDTSRTAARTAMDTAMSAQLATERAKQLSAASDSATESSRDAAQSSRSDQLSSSTDSIAAENERLVAEKKAAEAAAAKAAADKAAGKAAEAQAASAAAAAAAKPAAQPPQGTLSASVAKAATQSVVATNGAATSPMKAGTYTVGARFGAVGSWSRYHTGLDMPAPVGTAIVAPASGTVASPSGGGWAGTHVVIDHGNGATLYAHMSSTTVSVGQQVSAGQVIGYVGMTGRTFGPHLHWEYYPNASTVSNPYTTSDPISWLASRGASV